MQFSAYMLDVITDSIYPARISVEGGFFKEIVPIVINDDSELDISGIILPGFIDSHIHIESTMLTPAQFAKLAVRFGTTSVVCDPHEIANVAGTDGIDFMIENSKSVPFNFYFSIPSCVPATCFETSGAILDSETIGELLKKDEAVALGEMMNFPGVINGDGEVLAKLEKAKKLTSNPEALSAVKRLEEIYEILKIYGCEKYIAFDFGMLSKFRYYTGIIFQAYTYGTGEPLIKGGRYNELMKHFGKPASSIGFAIVVDNLMLALSRQKLTVPSGDKTVVITYEAGELKKAIQEAITLRGEGKKVALCPKKEEQE